MKQRVRVCVLQHKDTLTRLPKLYRKPLNLRCLSLCFGDYEALHTVLYAPTVREKMQIHSVIRPADFHGFGSLTRRTAHSVFHCLFIHTGVNLALLVSQCGSHSGKEIANPVHNSCVFHRSSILSVIWLLSSTEKEKIAFSCL